MKISVKLKIIKDNAFLKIDLKSFQKILEERKNSIRFPRDEVSTVK